MGARKTRKDFGTPYTVSEAELFAAELRRRDGDPYIFEIIEFLCKEIRRLEK